MSTLGLGRSGRGLMDQHRSLDGAHESRGTHAPKPAITSSHLGSYLTRPKEHWGTSAAIGASRLAGLDYDLVLDLSETQVVLSLSYLNPGAFFSASLVVSIVR